MCFTLAWHHGDGRGTKIETDDTRSNSVLRFLVRDTFQDELHVVTIALAVRPLRVRTGCLAPDEPRIFDRMPESMMHDRVMPVNHCRETVFAPEQPSLVALFGRLEFEAQSRLVPFIFHAVEAAPLAQKADLLCFAETNPIGGMIGAGCQRLCHHEIDMIGDPGTVGLFCEGVQGILGEAIRLPQSGECFFPLLLLRLWNGTCLLLCRVSAHCSQPFRRFTQ